MLLQSHRRAMRFWLAIFIAGLFLSGLTAFPLETELAGLSGLLHSSAVKTLARATHLLPWIDEVYTALIATNRQYPFLAYGTDWLAFAHIILAIAFIGAWRDPVRNRWLFDFGLIACAGVIPLALIAGPIRGVPLAWRLIDCSFGVFGCIPLLLCKKHLRALEDAQPVSLLSASVGDAVRPPSQPHESRASAPSAAPPGRS